MFESSSGDFNAVVDFPLERAFQQVHDGQSHFKFHQFLIMTQDRCFRTVAGKVEIEVQNHTGREVALQVYEQSGEPAPDAAPVPDFATVLDDLITRVWQVPLAPGAVWRAAYTGDGSGTIDLRGVDEHQKVVVDLDV